ncbi:uncharacterized protein LOC123672765 [Harmonia axyridis]|uniref:uncharacterized protein LOC123672765 n=1 Tax=Harmonia axyridis TaxID=115357 RepID=UPI001E2758F7|nr:uncharacterized protein LOC123672765 [Harmonia axyridis]
MFIRVMQNSVQFGIWMNQLVRCRKMCSTTLIILGILAVISIEVSGTQLHRKHTDDPLLIPYHPKPRMPYPYPAPGPPLLGSRYPSRHSILKSVPSIRTKPIANLGPKPGSFSTRSSAVGPNGRRNSNKHVVQPNRPKIPAHLNPKPVIGLNGIQPPRPNQVPTQIDIKPVFEKGMLPKMHVYVNAFPPESSQSETQESNDATKTSNYEPLGTYAKF